MIVAVTVAVVLAGLMLRVRGFLFAARPFWLDECSWAVFLVENRFGDDNLRPVGFMAVSRVLAALFSPTETVLRAIPWLSGMTILFLAPYLARRLYSADPARLLFIAVIALHPAAIDLSKEFKPYSTSLALHAGLLLATLCYVETRRTRDLVPVLIVAACGTLFAQDLVFAFPGVFVVMGWEAYKNRRAHLPWIGACAALINAALVLQYAFIWSRIPESESTYWGNRYNVFHVESDGQSYVRWSLDRFREIAEFPGDRRTLWVPDVVSASVSDVLRSLDSFVWTFAWLFGLGLLLSRRKVRVLPLLVLPCLVLWAFNALDFWPMGAFRTNLFVLVYATAVAVVPFDGSWGRTAPWFAPVPALFLVVAPLVAFERDWHASKRSQCGDGHLLEALAALEALRDENANEAREELLVSYGACSQWEYYVRIHPDAPRFRKDTERHFTGRCVKKQTVREELFDGTASGARVWLLGGRKLRAAALANKDGQSRLELLSEARVGSLVIASFQKPQAPEPVVRRRRPRSSQFEGDAGGDGRAPRP